MQERGEAEALLSGKYHTTLMALVYLKWRGSKIVVLEVPVLSEDPLNLTRHTDYGLRVLMVLTAASRGGRERLPTSEISEQFGISLNHLQKVVQRLQKGGYVHTTRGRGGGLSLAMAPAEISVAAVVKHMEPTMHVVECFDGTSCASCQPARSSPRWREPKRRSWRT